MKDKTLFQRRFVRSNFPLSVWLALGLAGVLAPAGWAADRFVSLTGGNQPPYDTWAAAATNIQDAIDVATDGEVVWVTNGVYASGGKVVAGDLTNRVVLDKALTVQSVNGPSMTIIQGAGATNGPLAVRCAWVTNGAVLSGFTLQGGATRTTGDLPSLQTAGGVWGASSNEAMVANCIIWSNAAVSLAAGTYQVSVKNSFITQNRCQSPGAGAWGCVLANCTISSNYFYGFAAGSATNCIVYFNNSTYNGPTPKCTYCCLSLLLSGVGNFNADPQLLPGGFHLANSSPCRAAGTNLVSGTDIDGQPWGNPPPVGCDQWQSAPMTPLPPIVQVTKDPVGFSISILCVGQEPFTCWWTRNGVPIEDDGHFSMAHTTNLVAQGLNPADAGFYQVVVSNAFGLATSTVAQLVMHYVDASGTGPTAPYLSWTTAATNIQDAIDAALPGEVVMVTNGIYASGGRATGGGPTNRVSLDKALTVQSVNGPVTTIIQGAWQPSVTNGPSAVRCAWMTNGAVLSGFTLQGGATWAAGSSNPAMSGGGAWCVSTNATLAGCVITSNVASYAGGGAYQATLLNCTLVGNGAVGPSFGNGGGAAACNLRACRVSGNVARSGGGTDGSRLQNCAVTQNSAAMAGGGANGGRLVNCTLIGNSSPYPNGGGGAQLATMVNCIVYGNYGGKSDSASNCSICTLTYSCSSPLPSGTGNISADPLLLNDSIHLTADSPCRGAGTNSVAAGTDIDGQAWVNPPSMGCDEFLPAPVIVRQPGSQVVGYPLKLSFSGLLAAGQEPLNYFWFKDGTVLQEGQHYTLTATTNLVLNGLEPEDAGTYWVVASNGFGMATSAVVRVAIHCVDAAAAAPAGPYSTWATAAPGFQEAIEASVTGDFILVTNGVYANGGTVMAGDLTNRVAVTKPVTLTSINGPDATIIQGAWDPATTNGPLAVRCAWLADGATLHGFTLQHGATRSTGDTATLQSGGGVWAASTNAAVINCVITNNCASYAGGGAYQGTLTRCKILWNSSFSSGGGAAYATLIACYVYVNQAPTYGGGVYYGNLVNCTVTLNRVLGAWGGGISYASAWNSILMDNIANRFVYNGFGANYYGSFNYLYNCDTDPLPAYNIGDIDIGEQSLDSFHLAVTSPCRGAGSAAFVSGTDLDGEPWANPPSMGCDEVRESALTGPLSVSLSANLPTIVVGGLCSLTGGLSGRATRVGWSFGDGSVLTNESHMLYWHSWTNAGDYTVTFTAYNTDHPDGVSTNLVVHVLDLVSPTINSATFNGTAFSINFTAVPGLTYVLEGTSDLMPPAVWQSVASIYCDTQPMQMADPHATNAMRFYRLRKQ